MEYYCHVWAGFPISYLEILNKLQNWTCRTVAVSLEPLAHHQNVVSCSLFYRNCFGRYSSGLAQLVSLSYSGGRRAGYSNRLHDFSDPIPRCYEDFHVNSFFSRTAHAFL